MEEIQRITEEAGCESFAHISRKANEKARAIAHEPNFITIQHAPTHLLCILQSNRMMDE